MKQILFVPILLLSCLINPLMGWELTPPIDHSKLNKEASLVAIVELIKLKETGRNILIRKNDVKCPQINLTFKVLKTIKGNNKKEIACYIYREPTNEELTKGGLSYDEIRQRLLDSVNRSQFNFANVKIGDRLLIYLKATKDGSLSPLTGDIDSSRSLLKITPSY